MWAVSVGTRIHRDLRGLKKSPGFGRIGRPSSLGCFAPLGALHARSRVAPGSPGRKAQEVKKAQEVEEEQIERIGRQPAHVGTQYTHTPGGGQHPAGAPGGACFGGGLIGLRQTANVQPCACFSVPATAIWPGACAAG